MNTEYIEKLFDEGAKVDDIIDAVRKFNTERDAAEKAKKQQELELKNAREEVVDFTKVYLMLAFEAAGVDVEDDKIDKTAEEMADALDELVKSVKGMYKLMDALGGLKKKIDYDTDTDAIEDDTDDDESSSDVDDNALARFIEMLRNR